MKMIFFSGNVNIYARILNGAAQLDKIKSYNQLAAWMALLQQEKQDNPNITKFRKKIDNKGKADKKKEKYHKE